MSDAWWLTAGALGVAALLITFILRTNAAERTGWLLYLTAWIPLIAGLIHYKASRNQRSLHHTRMASLPMLLAGAVMVAFHWDGFPLRELGAEWA
ncbi:hypothetical protein HEP86_37295 [Streptomyces sp. RPA4-5]|uniref:hypothetical protein n=1 Tax=Streptomyces sp. RPA4-5 TaxID=2721245 RepID=UPI00143E47EE|nr:hypothetical protein [Streptomyces sp. RPA4-5]QIY59066.1 hypothetical protein HEP86_37295 [Streptomyces sp. RPA4-5]